MPKCKSKKLKTCLTGILWKIGYFFVEQCCTVTHALLCAQRKSALSIDQVATDFMCICAFDTDYLTMEENGGQGI